MRRRNDFLLKTVGGQCLLVPVKSQVSKLNGIIVLNDSGRLIWELLADDVGLDRLVKSLETEFGIDAARAQIDVEAYLDSLATLGLLEK